MWFRRDLRLADNPALMAAVQNCDEVFFLYINSIDEQLDWQPGEASNWWLHKSLQLFTEQLSQCNAQLVVRSGNCLQVVQEVCLETRAQWVFWNRLYEPAVIERDKTIKRSLQSSGMKVTSFASALLREPWQVLKDDDTMYRVYTPFSKKYFLLDDIDIPLSTPITLKPSSQRLPSLDPGCLQLKPKIHWYDGFEQRWQPGEKGALKNLDDFLQNVLLDYSTTRDVPACDGVSSLSPYLHFGEISPRQIWHAVGHFSDYVSEHEGKDARSRALPFLKQLIWRDFAHHILYHMPHTTNQPFRGKFENFDWQDNPEFLQAWQKGKTGIPIVDAGMRQLWSTGWMHNRVRMIVASLLTKNGLIHWLHGARWFWDTLVDASLANNTMGWQWVAGCGVDAAPYFRIFSPVRQGERFDANGDYVKQWVPELVKLPSKYIHQPWNASESVLAEADVKLGRNYPEPIVDLSISRKNALARYKML